MQYDPNLCWLPFLGAEVDPCAQTPGELARCELSRGLAALGVSADVTLDVSKTETDGFAIERTPHGYCIHGGETGLLYGAYRLLMRLARGEEACSPMSRPAFGLRMLDHWDNMDGSVERGYAGRSLFFAGNDFHYDEARLRLYGRLLASVGVNVVALNNVNVQSPADQLLTEPLLGRLARVANLLRPFGVRLLVSVDYALPVTLGLPTADPLDERVQAFWREQTAKVYAQIPDLAGFLVKADSEFRPGPLRYGRNHAQGAAPLARALAPHGGVLVWRCFVYNCRQDWRDHTTDRPKAAYEQYAPFEGQFDENVLLQVKYGPSDFQVREPNSPLLYAMPRTRKALELQLAQEYTGQQIDLYYMPPQWAEILRDLGGALPYALCAVSNLGDDENWTGNDLAQANLYAYGRVAWEGKAEPEKLAEAWIRLTYPPAALETLRGMLLRSRAVYEQYTAPLALCWMVSPETHYGPNPEGYEYARWGTYLRADHQAVGVDRTSRGTNLTGQYPEPLRSLYDDPRTCPQELLLYFHRLRYDALLPNGKTLIQHIYDTHFEGVDEALRLLADWRSLEGVVPERSYRRTEARFVRQAENAREWCDIVNNYFHRLSGVDDTHGRRIY